MKENCFLCLVGVWVMGMGKDILKLEIYLKHFLECYKQRSF